MEKLKNQTTNPGDLIFIKPGNLDFIGWGISFFEGGAFSHVGINVDGKNMYSAGPQRGTGFQELKHYGDRQARINSQFRGNQRVINIAKSMAVKPTTYGFFPNQKTCSSACGSVISQATGIFWTGIGPNSQYITLKSYGE